MKIVILGGGPAGLYCGLLIKKAHPDYDVTILERNPAGVTYGWGVVFSDRTLASFQRADYKTYEQITNHFVIWDSIDTRYGGQTMRCAGHVIASISRKQLLHILQQRCIELGIPIQFGCEIHDLSELGEYDLLIGADGLNSLVRKTYTEHFLPHITLGQTKYIWLGAQRVLDAFTFIFRANEHGFFEVHAYPFSGTTSTFIVECDETTWLRAGLDQASEAESLAYCQRLLKEDLMGMPLLSNNSKWISFPTLTSQHWHYHNIVLLGDAVHTAHFSIGSGTKLAMEDAIALADALEQHPTIETALNEYELERKPVVELFQKAARESQAYFETARRYLRFEPMQFTFQLLTRSGRITYDDLRLRDPHFGDAVSRWYAQHTAHTAGLTTPSPLFAPPPLFAPLQLREVTIPNRIVMLSEVTASHLAETNPAGQPPTAMYVGRGERSPSASQAHRRPIRPPGDQVGERSPSAEDKNLPAISETSGTPSGTWQHPLLTEAEKGAGLVMTSIVAVSPDGRITPDDPGMYNDQQQEAWQHLVEQVHAHTTAKVAIQLGHAGRRGSTRPHSEGLDRPLRSGNWPLLSASPLPYTPQSQVPRTMDRAAMERVREDFARAARMADAAGFDLLQLHFAHGYLLASFLSPLTNRRTDEDGGDLHARMRFPLEVCEAVRAVWPPEKPLSVALSVTDCVKDGFNVADALIVAQELQARGCDILAVLAGQTTMHGELAYGRGFLTSLSDRVRNEAGIPTLLGGYLTTSDEINTILAAGRADLCIFSPRYDGGPEQ